VVEIIIMKLNLNDNSLEICYRGARVPLKSTYYGTWYVILPPTLIKLIFSTTNAKRNHTYYTKAHFEAFFYCNTNATLLFKYLVGYRLSLGVSNCIRQ